VLGVLRTLGRQSAAERADRRLNASEALAFRAQASVGTFHLDVHDVVANDDYAVALVTSHQEVGGVKYEDLARLATVIPCVRGGLLTMRPSSRSENNGEEGRWGTPN